MRHVIYPLLSAAVQTLWLLKAEDTIESSHQPTNAICTKIDRHTKPKQRYAQVLQTGEQLQFRAKAALKQNLDIWLACGDIDIQSASKFSC